MKRDHKTGFRKNGLKPTLRLSDSQSVQALILSAGRLDLQKSRASCLLTMRISGAPSFIRKRAAACDEAVDSLNLPKKQKKFVSPGPRIGTLQQLSNNGSSGPPLSSDEFDPLNCKPDNFARTAGDPGTGLREVISTKDGDYNGKAAECEHQNLRILETPPLPTRKQGVSATGEFSGRRKRRLGVGLVKPGFKPLSLTEIQSGASKQLNSTNVLLREPNRFPSILTTPKRVENQSKTNEETCSNYYCVMYCTRKLNAKHKGPWSDGVLISRGRSCTLQDAEGKFVTKDNGHRRVDMADGATFPLGKFEVEIMKKSTEEEFLSGTIFSETLDLQVDDVINQAHRRSFRSFKRPLVNHCRDGEANPPTTSSTISHPTTLHSSPSMRQAPTSGQKVMGVKQILEVREDALVLNASEVRRGATPVVVDPYLASRLRQHQQEGVRFMYECVMGLRNPKFTGCLLADAMGLGKTLQVIALIWTLLHQGPKGRPAVKRVLVICPTSLVENWGKEVRKWLGNERLNPVIIHSGTSSKDVKRKISIFQIGKLSPVLVTSYEFLRKYNDDLRSAKPELLVCDEAHRLKNCAGNKTIDALLALKCSMKVLLTGTPVQNDLMEFYAMLDFANKDLLGPVSAFRRLYADPIERSRDRNASDKEKFLGRKRSAELQLRTRLYILQRSSDVNLMYLPVKTELIVFCKLQALQVSIYQEFLKSKTVETMLHPSSQSAAILSAIGTLRKLCNHPQLVHGNIMQEKCQRSHDVTRDRCAPRYMMISAVHKDTSSGIKDKILVVSNFTQTLDIIQNLCEAQGWKWLRLDGSTEVSDRQSKVDCFNADDGKERVFLLSSKAGGSGLNLIGANRLVLFDPDWNPATDAQAMARVWRDGQKKPVLIYRLLSTGSIEEKIYQRQIMKQELAATVGEHIEGESGHGGRHFSREELRELFSLRLDTRCDTYDLLSQSTRRRTETWEDYSDKLQDYALENAIQTGVVTFIHKKVEEYDVRTFNGNTSGCDAASKSLENITEIDSHRSDNEGSKSCSLSEECSLTLPGSNGQSHSSDSYSLLGGDLLKVPLEEDEERRLLIENTDLPSSRSEPNLPSLVPSESDDREEASNIIASASERFAGRRRDVELENMEAKDDHPSTLERSREIIYDSDSDHCVSSERASDQKHYADVENDSRHLEHYHLDEGVRTCENQTNLDDVSQADRHESTTSTGSVETSKYPICQSENNCSCSLGGKGHKLLNYMLGSLRLMAFDLDDLEALDMPFLSGLELELELKRAEFTPQMLWEGFKLFVFGFLLGAKQERIYYGCSTLGLILDKCNGDKTSTTESVFCKGVPLVISALSRRHGREAVELPILLSLFENEGELYTTPNGRFLIELTRRWNSSYGTMA